MKKEINSKNREEANTPTITYTNEQIEIDTTSGKIADDIAFVKELIASGAFERLDKLIEQTRAEKKLNSNYSTP